VALGVAHAEEPETDEDDDADLVLDVTSTRRPTSQGDQTAATRVIDREVIERSGADTAAELLEMVAGVQVFRSFRGAGVRIRGHDPDHVLVLVDGQRMNGRVDGVIDLSRFRTDDIERIEILPGAGSSIWGSDAMGGVIHIVTRRAREGAELRLGASGGGFVSEGTRSPLIGNDQASLGVLDQLDGFTSVSIGRERWTLFGSASALLVDPWTREVGSLGTMGSGFRTFDTNLSASVDLTEVTTLSLNGAYLYRDALGTDASPTGAVVDRLNRTETGNAGLRLAPRPHPRHQLSFLVGTSVFRDQFLEDQRGATSLDRLQLTQDVTVQVQAMDAMDFGDHKPTVGVDALFEDARTDRVTDGQVARGRVGLYALDTWRITAVPRAQIEPSVRLDLDTQFGASVAPRVALRFDPTGIVRIRASAGSGFKAPDFRELYLRFDNPGANYRIEGSTALRPERSVGFNADVEVQPTDTMAVAVSGWHDDIRDLIQAQLLTEATTSAPSLFTYGNVSRARIAGAAAEWTLRTEAWRASLSYTWTHTRDLELDQPLEGRPEHVGAAMLMGRWLRTGLTGTLRGNVVGPRTFGLAGTAPTVVPTTVNVDLRAGLDLEAGVQLHVGVDNLLDAGANAVDPLRPRRVYGGFTSTFGLRRRAVADVSLTGVPDVPDDPDAVAGTDLR
jgi:outer membrane receptor for ferrienterochelin and colicins